MKKRKIFLGMLAGIATVLIVGGTALAASLGVSPASTEIEVPARGSATVSFNVYYYSGDISISMVDIPLKIEPETVHVDSSSKPASIRLTIYGDESLGSRIYNGYVRFLGLSEDTATVAVRSRAQITNLVEGETPILAIPQEPEESTILEESSNVEETPVDEVSSQIQIEVPPPTQEDASATQEANTTQWPILPLAGIAAGTIIVVVLIIVVSRRFMY